MLYREKLVDAGEQAMRAMGLKRVDKSGHHLRGDTETGQRVKMTAIKGARGSMFLLMTAGMPGTREKAKQITSQLATQIETLAREQSDEA
ncbi:MAG: hypothetical protein O2820_12435 [Planctomycetota bacterium]|nr:hypothetical protein [Planctomycetota bacterium]MDA1250018.1 hypothetical protein [Planctomycetota bacterium]